AGLRGRPRIGDISYGAQSLDGAGAALVVPLARGGAALLGADVARFGTGHRLLGVDVVATAARGVRLRDQRGLGLQPVVDLVPGGGAALQIDLVGPLRDRFFAGPSLVTFLRHLFPPRAGATVS